MRPPFAVPLSRLPSSGPVNDGGQRAPSRAAAHRHSVPGRSLELVELALHLPLLRWSAPVCPETVELLDVLLGPSHAAAHWPKFRVHDVAGDAEPDRIYMYIYIYICILFVYAIYSICMYIHIYIYIYMYMHTGMEHLRQGRAKAVACEGRSRRSKGAL